MIYYSADYNFKSEALIDILPYNRREKALRIIPERDRQNCILAYLMLKYAYNEAYGNKSFEILTGKNGKPFIKNSDFYFNFSHCKNGVICAVANSPLGADIQNIKPFNLRTSQKVCTQDEINYIKISEKADEEFTRFWTLKESIVKCKAQTLAQMNNYSFESPQKSFYAHNKYFETYKPGENIISVCGDIKHHDIKNIMLADLL